VSCRIAPKRRFARLPLFCCRFLPCSSREASGVVSGHVSKFWHEQKASRLGPHVTNDRARLSMGLTVIKRDGREEPVAFDKITARINKLAYGLNQDHCDPVRPSVLRIFRMPPRDSKKPALFPRLARRPLAPRDAPRRTTHAVSTSRVPPLNEPPGPRDMTPARVADRPKTASAPLVFFSSSCFSERRYSWRRRSPLESTRASPRASSTSSPRRPPRR
jgi:hypothetical protein